MASTACIGNDALQSASSSAFAHRRGFKARVTSRILINSFAVGGWNARERVLTTARQHTRYVPGGSDGGPVGVCLLKGSVGSSQYQKSVRQASQGGTALVSSVEVSYCSVWSKVTAPRGYCTKIRTSTLLLIEFLSPFFFVSMAVKSKAVDPLDISSKKIGVPRGMLTIK